MWNRAAALIVLAPVLALAHPGEPLQPDDLWSAWEFDPGVVIPLLLSAFLYFRGARRHRGLRVREKLCFWAGWSMLALALVSPLHPVGEVLFSAHMVQHEILMLVAAPLMVISRPLVTFLWALPFEWRRGLGRWSKTDSVRKTWGFLTDPFAAWCIHAAAIWIWHVPVLFQATLTSELAHTAQHLSFFFVRPAVLVGAVLCAWTSGLRRGRVVRVYDRHTHQRSRSAADLRSACLVSRLQLNHASLGLDSFAGPADWRARHVGSGRARLPDRRLGAVRGLAQGKRCNARENAARGIDLHLEMTI